jgi:hypothetical protein
MQVLKVTCMAALKSWMDLSIITSSLYPNSVSNYDNEESCLILDRKDLIKFNLHIYSLLQNYLVVSWSKSSAIRREYLFSLELTSFYIEYTVL